MLANEVERESRIGENPTYGLVCEVKPMRRRRRGFTLIELLVVIAIIGIIASLLLPALAEARARARTVICASNVRQLNIAFRMYTDEYNGQTMPIKATPTNQYWPHLLGPYLGDPHYADDPDDHSGSVTQVLLCPETEKRLEVGYGTAKLSWKYSGGGYGSYGLNCWFQPWGVYQDYSMFPRQNYFMRFDEPREPSETPVIADSNWVGSWPDDTDLFPADVSQGERGHVAGRFMGRFCVDRHRMAINVSFADGSTRGVRLDHLWSLKWHKHFATR